MGIITTLAKRAAKSKKDYYFIDYVRNGWNNYSFIFYIGSISVILGGMFGIAGWLSVFVTVYFFYTTGKFKHEMELERERIRREEKRA